HARAIVRPVPARGGWRFSPPDRMSESARIELDEAHAGHVFGVRDANLRAIEQATGARISARGGTVVVEGSEDSVRLASMLVSELVELVSGGMTPKAHDVEAA